MLFAYDKLPFEAEILVNDLLNPRIRQIDTVFWTS